MLFSKGAAFTVPIAETTEIMDQVPPKAPIQRPLKPLHAQHVPRQVVQLINDQPNVKYGTAFRERSSNSPFSYFIQAALAIIAALSVQYSKSGM